MSRAVEAIFEKGVLKPLEKIDLKEHQKVEIVVWRIKGTDLFSSQSKAASWLLHAYFFYYWIPAKCPR